MLGGSWLSHSAPCPTFPYSRRLFSRVVSCGVELDRCTLLSLVGMFDSDRYISHSLIVCSMLPFGSDCVVFHTVAIVLFSVNGRKVTVLFSYIAHTVSLSNFQFLVAAAVVSSLVLFVWSQWFSRHLVYCTLNLCLSTRSLEPCFVCDGVLVWVSPLDVNNVSAMLSEHVRSTSACLS